MSFPQGINFRGSVGYVTDGANDFFAGTGGVGSGSYPTTSTQGNTVGWEGGVPDGTADRNNAIDVRLAGIEYVNVSPKTYRIDLSATGSWDVRVAAGDAGGSNSAFVNLKDTTTVLGPLVTTHTAMTSGTFYDATDALYSSANWPGSNTAVTKSFATTICRFINGDGTNLCVIAHASVAVNAGATGGPFPMFTPPLRGGMRQMGGGMQG